MNYHSLTRRLATIFWVLFLAGGGAAMCWADGPPVAYKYSVDELTRADEDILANDALALPGGPTYEFFAQAMPPLRYVDASFLRYPIVLCGPSSALKARIVSDGSSVNARSAQPSWSGQPGIQVEFFAGDLRDKFGSDLSRLAGPKYAEGYLPIVQCSYTTRDGATIAEEAFCSTSKGLVENAVVFVKLTLTKASGTKHGGKFPLKVKDAGATAAVAGVESPEIAALNINPYDDKIEAQFDGGELYAIKNKRLVTGEGKVLALLYPIFAANPGRAAVIAPLNQGHSAYLAIYTKPGEADGKFELTPETYESERAACAKTWNDVLSAGMTVETPEAVVNNAWRASMIGNYELFRGDEIHYSAGNGYDKRYIGEGGDTLRATAMWGHSEDARRLMPAQFNYTRKGLEFHQAAFKLQMLAHYFVLTRDAEYVKSIRPLWQKEIDVIVKGRQTENGMFPREKYCGDIATLVYSLNSNSNCWRALRDMSGVLAEIGDTAQAQSLAQNAAEYRKIILAAIEHATRRETIPPFIPIALSGEEDPHDPIWASTIGSYWNLMIEYVLGSGVFPPDSQTATDVLQYIQQKGGMCMGIVRARAETLNFYVSGGRMNDLYGMRYALTLLRRDEVDRALVSFYGKLAQGMTRDTFIGGEGSSMGSVDAYGRQMYLPPNSCGNANYLQQLRYLLIQDYDMNDDGRPETLRLLFATPRAWLADGKQIKFANAPTAFGNVSLTATSHLSTGEVTAEIDLPATKPEKIYLRLRLPDGKKLASATANNQSIPITNNETVDLTGLTGHVTISAKTTK